ncbi:glycosyltransferase [Marivirga sp.]|uniref:glycosyltransferase n=1 Tax=Marivirga sp. TaxID=2018662 RepID=UPI0025E5A9CA|nr:glycosyltransferase [Marivirga sp.]
MIFAFFSIVILFYALALLFASKIWRKLPEFNESGELKSVSIIIPFRNEEENLSELLNSLSYLEYPADLLEVILINDHSEDSFKEIIQSFDKSFPFKLTVLSLPAKLNGKKSAINAGIKHSESEIILTSDADCSFPKDWIQKMQAPFEIEHIQLVSGSVVFKPQNFISRIFQMEFAPLIGVGAVSIELGNPNMANGANLAFRKKTFEKLNPYADNISIPSGDDVFLLQKIKAEYPNAIFFQKEAIVETQAPENFNSFYRQRKRWAVKWSASASLKDSLPALAIWSFHLIYIVAIIYSLISAQFLILLPTVFLKIITEGIFISLILKSQDKEFKFIAFVFLQLFYSLYVLIFGLLANFGSYTWKERKFNSNERAGN